MATILGRRRHRGAADRLRRRPAGQGRDAPRSCPACSTPCSRAAEIVPLDDELRDRADRHRRHRRRPQPLDQRVHDGRDRGGRRRRAGVQARRPGRVVAVRHGRRARSARCGHRARPGRACCAASTRPGMGFCLAPRYHPSFRFAAPSRREIGIPTVFNLLGPMANPGRVRRQLIGVANPAVAERMLGLAAAARLAPGLGRARQRARRADHHGHRPPCSRSRTTTCARSPSTRWPSAWHRRSPRSSSAATPAHNADVVRRVLAGEHGPHRNIVAAQRRRRAGRRRAGRRPARRPGRGCRLDRLRSGRSDPGSARAGVHRARGRRRLTLSRPAAGSEVRVAPLTTFPVDVGATRREARATTSSRVASGDRGEARGLVDLEVDGSTRPSTTARGRGGRRGPGRGPAGAPRRPRPVAGERAAAAASGAARGREIAQPAGLADLDEHAAGDAQGDLADERPRARRRRAARPPSRWRRTAPAKAVARSRTTAASS